MTQKISRRDFLKMAGASATGLVLTSCGVNPTALPTVTKTPTPFTTATPTQTNTATATATPIPRTLGTLASKLGIGFATMARVSQLSKQGYLNDLNNFNGIGFTEAYMTGLTRVNGSVKNAFNSANGKYNWGYFDLAVDYGMKQNIPIQVTHHLVWSKTNRLPEWVLSIKDPKEIEQVMENHIKTVLTKAGQFSLPNYPYELDIANTPLENNPIFQSGAKNVPLFQAFSVVNEPNYWNPTWYEDYFYQILGEKYIFKAFEFARKYAVPGTLLLLNDDTMLLEGNTGSNLDNPKGEPNYLDRRFPRFEKNMQIAALLKKDGLIDGLGFQLHINAALPLYEEEVNKRLQIVVDEGLVAIPTELDVRVDDVDGEEIYKQQKQADALEFWVKTFYESGKCRLFNTFMTSDNDSWYDDIPNANETMFDVNYEPKPSYERILSLFDKLLAKKVK